jgi:general stress protein 26
MTRDEVYAMLHDFSTSMMITRDPSGPLDCRPMRLARVDPDGPLWFFASADSRKVLEIRTNPEVLLVLQDPHRQHVALWGRADIVDDHQRALQFWHESYRVWFPQGVTDPALTLIAVHPHTIEFWDNTGRQHLRYVFEPAEASPGPGRRG